MDKQTFIAAYLAKRLERLRSSGSLRRTPFNTAVETAKAEAKWNIISSPEYIAKQARIASLVEKGGTLWEGDQATRVYFTVKHSTRDYTFPCFVDADTGAIGGGHGTLSADDMTTARLAIFGGEA